jgi:hypothetical protein
LNNYILAVLAPTWVGMEWIWTVRARDTDVDVVRVIVTTTFYITKLVEEG